MICYDEIDEWELSLAEVLLPLAPPDIQRTLQMKTPEYIEDARDIFLQYAECDSVVDAMLTWLQSTNIAAYHGTRLETADVESIKSNGLIPLQAGSRRERLSRALSQHPRWLEVAPRLDDAIREVGPGCAVGNREGQVHLTLSHAGLTRGFNHYLTHGAEFDWHVASELLGEEGKELLRTDGTPYVIQVAVPGAAALAAAHQYFKVEDLRARGELPNIVHELLNVWCFRLARPGYQSRNSRLDCGMVFKARVPSEWIRRIETWTGK